MEDFIDIDGPEDDIEDDGLSNKPLSESFYFILLLSVYNYLDYTDFFISIRFEGVGKGAIAVIAAILITAGTPLAATAEIAATPGKGAMAVIVAMLITVGTPLVVTAETVVTPGTRLDQIGLLKGVGSISGFKVRFCNNIIVIKKSGDIDIMALNDKAAMPGVTTLEVLQLINQILECKRITHL